MPTDQATMLMQAQLKFRADQWNPNGIRFLIKRSNARSSNDRVIVKQLIDHYTKGDFDAPSAELTRAVAPAFGISNLNPEVILIILLGRAPYWRGGLIEERHQVLTPPQTKAQEALARVLTGGKRYLNKAEQASRGDTGSREIAIPPLSVPSPRTVAPQREAEKPIQVQGADRPQPATGTPCAQGRNRLVTALRNRTAEMNRKLDELKAGASQFEHRDFIWNALVEGFSTMGNSRGYYGLVKNRALYSQITYDAIEALPEPQRRPHLERVLREGKVRMPRVKAEWLASNFNRIVTMGGPEEAKRLAESQRGTAAKIAFLRRFDGIGAKYGRNLWMVIYHPDFRESIAVDERIKKLSETMGCSFRRYEDHEQFYLDIAHEAGIDGWELDRLVYNYLDYFLSQVRYGGLGG